MNNAAFRSLVSTSKSSQDGEGRSASSSTGFKRPQSDTNLGSRSRSSILMTPRNVSGHDSNREFARQVAQHTSSNAGEPPLKKFKSSAAPKGTKLGKGYVDRAAMLRAGTDARRGAEDGEGYVHDGDDKEARLKNLEEQLKLGQISQKVFDQLKEQMGVGGDVTSTHLVKGLDWKLLERVRRGEDISKDGDGDTQNESPVKDVDVDEELEKALEKEVTKGYEEGRNEPMEAGGRIPQDLPQQVLTRDEILRQFREQRNAPATSVTPAVPVLNGKFKKVAAPEKSAKKKFVESVNGRRREVLIITKKDGTTKRKTRWIDPEDITKPKQQPLGMEVPAEMAAKQRAMQEAEAVEDDDEDIFKDAGNDYDPLAGIESDEDDKIVASEQEMKKDNAKLNAMSSTEEPSMGTTKRRNYFSTSRGEDEADPRTSDAIANDPNILAALKRAAQMRQREEGSAAGSEGQDDSEHVGAGAKSSAFLAKLKERERQDAADLDYGFGESRFGDDDDDEAGPLYDEGEDDDGTGKKKGGRKRGPKKRKDDKDNVKDVMGVLEGRNKKAAD